MKKYALAVALLFATGMVTTAVYANSTNATEISHDKNEKNKKKKKKKNKKKCSKEGEGCCAKKAATPAS